MSTQITDLALMYSCSIISQKVQLRPSVHRSTGTWHEVPYQRYILYFLEEVSSDSVSASGSLLPRFFFLIYILKKIICHNCCDFSIIAYCQCVNKSNFYLLNVEIR